MKKYLNSIVLLVFVLFSYQNISFASENNASTQRDQQYKDNKLKTSLLQEQYKQVIEQKTDENDRLNKEIKELKEDFKDIREINDDLSERIYDLEKKYKLLSEMYKFEKENRKFLFEKLIKNEKIDPQNAIKLQADEIDRLNNENKELKANNLIFKQNFLKARKKIAELDSLVDDFQPKAEQLDAYLAQQQAAEACKESSEIEFEDLPENVKEIVRFNRKHKASQQNDQLTNEINN